MTIKQPTVYVMASRKNGTLYVGVTGFLVSRVHQHRERLLPGFTTKYDTKLLVHYEFHPDFPTAILREKRIKGWKREWKIKLIEAANPYWRDLWPDLIGSTTEQNTGLRATSCGAPLRGQLRCSRSFRTNAVRPAPE